MFTKNTEFCKKARVYDSEKNIPDLNAVWYYSSHVTLLRRTIIDQRIMELRESGEMDIIADAGFGSLPEVCKTNDSRIGVSLLAVPIITLAGPILIIIIIQMLYYMTRKKDKSSDSKLQISSIRIESLNTKVI